MGLWAGTRVVAAKDLRMLCRDRTGLLLAVALPIVLITVFGFVMQFAFGGSGGAPKVALWVADEDGSEQSRTMCAELAASGMLVLRPADPQATTAEALRERVREGDATHALVLGQGFGAAIAAGGEPPMTLIRDPGSTLEDQLVKLGIMQAFMAATQGQLWPASFARQMRTMGMDAEDADRLLGVARTLQQQLGTFAASQADSGSPASGSAGPGAAEPAGGFAMTNFMDSMVSYDVEDIAPPDRDEKMTGMLAQSISGVSVMMLLFGMMGLGSALLQERDQGTLQRILASGMPRSALLWGKALSGVVFGALQLLLMLAYGSVLFGVDLFRDPITLVALVIAWSLAAIGFGLVIATWARSQKQSEGIATIAILVMAAVGGCWFPIQLAGDLGWFDVVTHATITFWGMSGFQNLFWHHASLADRAIWQPLLVLLGFAIAAMLIARTLYFRRFVARAP